MKKFILGKGPFVRSVDEKRISTRRMMNDVIIALIPIAIFGWIINGIFPFIKGIDNNFYHAIQPLINVLCGCFFSLFFEGMYFFCFEKTRGFKNIWTKLNLSFAVIPGLILALILPARIDIYVIIFGCFIANIVFKLLFGGFGHNIFNPALIGYAFCVITFGTQISAALNTQVVILNDTFAITATATPLGNFANVVAGINSFNVTYEQIVASFGSLLNLFIGAQSGALGETSALLCIAGFVYLVARKVINWRIPVVYIGTTFILTWIIGMVNGVQGPLLGIWFPTFNILTGGLMFGAVFMATEPVTTPKTPNGKVIFAVLLGVLTVLFRFVGSLPEGVGTAILFTCLFTPVIDRFAARLRGPIITFKIVFRYIIFAVLCLCISGYIIYKTSPKGMELPQEQAVYQLAVEGDIYE